MIVFVTVFTPTSPNAALLFGPPTRTQEGIEVEVDEHVDEVEIVETVTVIVRSGELRRQNTPACCGAWFAATDGL